MAQTVIVGLSGSPASMRALQWAGTRVTGDAGHLVCVTVDNMVPPQLLYTGMPTLPFADTSIEIAADAIMALSANVDVAAARTLPATAHVSLAGDVAARIREVALERGADLVVIGGRASSLRWPSRSVAEQLGRCLPCPLVVVP